MKKEKQNLSIHEKQRVPGGEYEDVNISGAGQISEDLTCRAFKVSGFAVVGGSVCGDEHHISGKVQINGELRA